tara:strand:+ start:4013 stop:4888 length:876 start_codon:yes stop_codon:yes gene_type:complete
MNSDNIGIVVLAHGSQRGFTKDECSCHLIPNGDHQTIDDIPWCMECPDTAKGVTELRDMIQGKMGNGAVTVISSFLEFLAPDPFQAVEELVSKGISNIVIFPFLLGNGKHATLEMEEIRDDLSEKHPGISLRITQGIGADIRLANIIKDRAQVVVTDGEDESKHGVIIVKAGTKTEYDDCEWLRDISELVQAQLGESFVTTYAQSHYGLPEIDERTNYLIKTHGIDKITFVPYVFFPGLILQRNIMGSIKKYQKEFSTMEFALCPPLGITTELRDIAIDRIENSLKNGSND